MRNKFSNGRLSYFLTPRIHGNVIAWVKPSSQWETEWEKAETMINAILRWADEWQLVICYLPAPTRTITQGNGRRKLPQVAETNTPRLMDVARECLLYYESRRNVHQP